MQKKESSKLMSMKNKIIIAEKLLGQVVYSPYDDNPPDNGITMAQLRCWNPDTHPEQLKEVWNKLGALKMRVLIEIDEPGWGTPEVIDCFLNNPLRVIEGVCEVLEPTK